MLSENQIQKIYMMYDEGYLPYSIAIILDLDSYVVRKVILDRPKEPVDWTFKPLDK